MKISKVIKRLPAVMLSFLIVSALLVVDSKPAIANKPSTKPTVVVVSSHSCPMCVEFEKRVLNNAEVRQELTKFTLKKEDASSTRIKVEVTPTVVIFDRDNKQIKKFVPSLDKAKFIQILKQLE